MTWKPRVWPVVFLLAAAGCGGTAAPTADPAKKITWQQYEKMSVEERGDPYVLNNLDPDAQKKFADRAKKKK